MNDIGIIIALNAEAGSLTSKTLTPGRPEKVDGHIWACITGMGAANALAGMDKLIRLNVDKIVNWGVAGGLHHGFCSGDIVIPATVSDGVNVLRIDSGWHHSVCSAWSQQNRRFHTGNLVSTNKIISTVSEKHQLADATDGMFVDMESYAIAEKAVQMNIDFLSVKSIADEMDTPIPACIAGVTDAFGEPDILGLIWNILKSPAQVKPLVKLFRSFNKASKALRSLRNDLFDANFYYPDNN